MIQNIPEIFKKDAQNQTNLFVYDFRMTDDVVKSKVKLNLHMFSFLQIGEKQVHFANNSVTVNEKQAVIIKSGNILMTELINKDLVYFCKLFFFSQKNVEDFLQKHANSFTYPDKNSVKEVPFFVIENDAYTTSFVNSLSSIQILESKFAYNLLSIKFEEIMLYLSHKYESEFIPYLHSLTSLNSHSSFRKIIETNIFTNLKLEEIAFLCNMSLSTFKRHFINEYHENPGKWLQNRRLHKAKAILREGILKPSEIYEDFGYNNLSNFSSAFKKEFGINPKNAHLL
ncbi:MAG: AraC family transcriptional regulator [Bacteroidetes bacterium HGW-Bacteroidetes-3]|jgi:AraC-like DNA-binding protein|nr:MAG: AraC family transcriptional regulator [Bacteroidetes bacterium HGW-Bacteroidetes-3]